MRTKSKTRARKKRTFADLMDDDDRSPDALAEDCGVARSYLYDIRRGLWMPKRVKLHAIANGLGRPVRAVREAIAESMRRRRRAEARS